MTDLFDWFCLHIQHTTGVVEKNGAEVLKGNQKYIPFDRLYVVYLESRCDLLLCFVPSPLTSSDVQAVLYVGYAQDQVVRTVESRVRFFMSSPPLITCVHRQPQRCRRGALRTVPCCLITRLASPFVGQLARCIYCLH